MRKVILYIAISTDGFIAKVDGSVDWLPTEGELGYKQFYDSVDTLLMGKKTYDQVLGFGKWPYAGKECIVFTKHKNVKDEKVTFSDKPINLTKELAKKNGKDIWLIGGSQINSVLLSAGLINKIILTIIPTILGRGLPLFNPINKDINLKLIESKDFKEGLVQITYDVINK